MHRRDVISVSGAATTLALSIRRSGDVLSYFFATLCGFCACLAAGDACVIGPL